MSCIIFNCSKCVYQTNKKFNLNRHITSKHKEDYNINDIINTNDINDNKCDKCNKILSSKRNLNNHLLNCNGVSNPLECHICHKILANRGSKSSHLKICKNKPIELINIEEPSINQIIMTINYKCSKCSFQSNKRIDIYNHINLVHRENIRIKNNDENNEYIYLLQEREFIKTKEPIYKIGKTKQENLKRIKSYPNGSKLLFYNDCIDCDNIEKVILNKFKEHFIHKKIIKYIEYKYFNEEFPENRNIKYENNNCLIRENGKWKMKDLNNIIDDLIDKNKLIIIYNNFIEYTDEDNEKEIIDNYKYITNELKVLIKSSKSI